MTFKEAAIQVLKESKKPLHSKEITRIALKRKLIKSKGKKPEATMNVHLLMDIEKGRESKFIQVGPSTFGLRLKHKRYKRTKKRKSFKGALIKGMSKNLPSDILVDPVFKKKLRELLRGYAGIYTLYKGERLLGFKILLQHFLPFVMTTAKKNLSMLILS